VRDASADAFTDLFESERRRLYGALVVATRDPHMAEDLSQEAFTRMWAKWDRVSKMRDPIGYLYRTAMNLYLDEVRKSRRHATSTSVADLPSRAHAPDDLQMVEGQTMVEKALLALAPRQRAALVVTEFLGYDSAAAGRILSVRPGTIRRLTSLARKQLAVYLGEEDEFHE
jgi:RNA polymerase sigma-70 factor (ECF subfamily)